jgi:hypothetical protein
MVFLKTVLFVFSGMCDQEKLFKNMTDILVQLIQLRLLMRIGDL